MECPVCLEIFQVPLLLPGCGHTICQTCAELLVTPDKYLRCPECRLVYQLRRGVESLPKNIALQRTISEQRSTSRENLLSSATCADHPGDAVSLYCKTCDKPICLKCYFSNTLRRGQTTHSGHQVLTSEDVFTKERRQLEENYNTCLEQRVAEAEYISQLEQTEQRLKVLTQKQDILEQKTQEIEKNKNELISQIKKTAAKLKFTLKGSVARDSEFLQMALQSARERLAIMDKLLENTETMRDKAYSEMAEIQTIREVREKLEVLPGLSDEERAQPASFLGVEKFDTDLKSCVQDVNKALSYQTEPPRTVELCPEQCIVSDRAAYIVLQYNETVRVSELSVHYKQALYKGLSEKQWSDVQVTEMCGGKASVCLQGLDRATMYKLYARAVNVCGKGPPSKELWFRTASEAMEIKSP